MVERCVMIVPELKNAEALEAIRAQYDPLYGLAAPHITLVFPFQSGLEDAQVLEHVRTVTSMLRPFSIELGGISGRQESSDYYLFLDVRSGEAAIRSLSRALYTGILAPYRTIRYDTGYTPHITVGRMRSQKAYTQALRSVIDFTQTFETYVREVAIERIGPGGESTIEATVKLGR